MTRKFAIYELGMALRELRWPEEASWPREQTLTHAKSLFEWLVLDNLLNGHA